MSSVDCVVNVATGAYIKGQRRLVDGLARIGFDGEVLLWTDELPEGSLSHDRSPMGFKPLAIKSAIDRGCRRVLWLDANCLPIRKLDGLFGKIRKDGYFLYSQGAIFGEWCSDSALESFGIDRESSLSILEINSSCIGISAESPVAMDFLREWEDYALDGTTFRGIDSKYPLSMTELNEDSVVSKDPRVKGHRHDQTCASFLAWKYRMRYSSMEISNFQSIGASGENVYARTIPLTASILQCRDAKREGGDFLIGIDEFGNRRGLSRLWFIALSLAMTMRKYIAFRGMRARMGSARYYSPEKAISGAEARR